MLPRPALVVALAVPAVAFGACGGPGTVDSEEIERQAQAGLTKSVGQQAPRPNCPDDLDAEVGATTRCQMTFPNGDRLGITVKVTSVDDGTAKFDIQADRQLQRR